jgi:hypothetical protein
MTKPRIEHWQQRANLPPGASTIELLADELVTLLEEFEAAISQGDVPHAFAARLDRIRRDAEKLIDQ